MSQPHDGDFYIDKSDAYLFLRQLAEWDRMGKLMRTHVLGLTSEGPFPFTALQIFELALGETDEHYYPAFSLSRSMVTAIFPTAASCNIVLTDDLANFLSNGSHVICTAHFEGVAQHASLSFNDVIVRARTPLWIVMPASADVAMAGLRCLFASEPL